MREDALWIVCDGPDGVGKTTTCKMVAEILDGVYVSTLNRGPISKAVRTRYNDKTIKKHPTNAYLLWMLSGIAETYYEDVERLLATKHTVISDRWLSSTYAYQIHSLNNPSSEYIYQLTTTNNWLIDRTPTLYINCHAPASTIEDRIMKRGLGDRGDTVPREEKLRITEGFTRYYLDYTGSKLDLDCTKSTDEIRIHLTDILTNYKLTN